MPAFSSKETSCTAKRWLLGAPDPAPSTDSEACGAGSWSGRTSDLSSSRDGAKPRPALAGGDEALPVGDREFDRSERPGDQDRGGDHDAARRLVVDDEIGADAEHAGLQRHAHHLREGAEPARHVRGLLLMA